MSWNAAPTEHSELGVKEIMMDIEVRRNHSSRVKEISTFVSSLLLFP